MDKSTLFCMFQVVVALSFSSCFFYSYFSKSYIWWPRSSVTTPQLHYSALSLLREFAAEQTCKSHDVISLSNYQVRSSAVMLRTEATRNSRSIHPTATDRPETNSTELVTSQLAVGLAVAITSKGSVWKTTEKILQTFPFFHTLLPSFCATVTPGVANFHFFISFDDQDSFFKDPRLLCIFTDLFHTSLATHCGHLNADEVSLHLVQCNHNKHPAWAQNDAVWTAYLFNMEYIYRLNDDSKLISKHWLERMVTTLREFDPPNLGVVGPNHKGGNTAILTYDFVHKTHLELFGFHYPRVFINWSADNWITDVYSPERMRKLVDVVLRHTLEKGQRYKQVAWPAEHIKPVVEAGKAVIER